MNPTLKAGPHITVTSCPASHEVGPEITVLPGPSKPVTVNTPLSLLSIGLQVHSLGGGVMVMVPNEASSVRVLTMEHANPAALESISAALHSGSMEAAYASGDQAIQKILGKPGLDLVYQGIERLSHWRTR